jgi:hypothetical protein
LIARQTGAPFGEIGRELEAMKAAGLLRQENHGCVWIGPGRVSGVVEFREWLRVNLGVEVDPARAWWKRLAADDRAAYLSHLGIEVAASALPWEKLADGERAKLRAAHDRARARFEKLREQFMVIGSADRVPA